MKIVRIGDDFFQSYWRTLWENSQYKYPLHTPLWGDFYEWDEYVQPRHHFKLYVA